MPSYLTPTAYLERIGGGQTAAEHEIWDTAHRLYVYLATSQRETSFTPRIVFLQRLVRLCSRHSDILLAGIEALDQNDNITLERCTTCINREFSSPASNLSSRTTGHCCWFRPDAQARAFLWQLVAFCDSQYTDLFNGSTSPEELSEMFTFA
ncbi:hypothetical protein SCUCBS95973_003093 [Sporothrix curviconia]|uniref:Uncharacterized protein n=1 Tax=Sporothrix curviconia TaxID=1260050 RepID=A0ABP0BCE5_9PEZI